MKDSLVKKIGGRETQVCQATSSRKKAKNNREPSRRLPEKRRRRRICISFGLGP